MGDMMVDVVFAMNFAEAGYEDDRWIELAEDSVQWWAFV
jgi:hypothetical protein